MNAVPVFARLIGDDWEPGVNFTALWREAEKWAVTHIEAELWWWGQHPDIPDLEQDSVWELVEYAVPSICSRLNSTALTCKELCLLYVFMA